MHNVIHCAFANKRRERDTTRYVILFVVRVLVCHMLYRGSDSFVSPRLCHAAAAPPCVPAAVLASFYLVREYPLHVRVMSFEF